MALSTKTLAALAKIYGATPTQLQAPPTEAEMVSTLDRAQNIIQGMDKSVLEQWLAIGEKLKAP